MNEETPLDRNQPRADDARGTNPAGQGARIRSLDGLRGGAALLVVLGHASLVNSDFYDWLVNEPGATIDSHVTWIPLGLGGEAVFLFFVLSGFVLARAYTPDQAATSSYLGSRLIRLYVPIWGALLVGLVVQWAIRWSAATPSNAWFQSHFVDITLASLIRDVLVIDGTTWVNSSAWSMRYEVIFSLLLPIILLAVALVTRRRARVAVAGVFVIALMYAAVDRLTTYLCMFFVGAVLARIRIPPIPGRAALVLGLLGAALFTSYRTVPLVTGQPFGRTNWLWYLSITAASSIFIVLAVENRACRALLSSALPQYVGRRSYSIYLIQAPVIVATTMLLRRATGSANPAPWWSLLALSLALLSGMAFYRIVELPSHSLARRLRNRAPSE